MPAVLHKNLYKTTSLRSQKYASYNISDIIVTAPMNRFTIHRDLKKIVSYPQAGWADDYEKNGKHLSRRIWKNIKGSHKKQRWRINTKQERRFRYNPAIPLSDNPAFLDIIIEFV